MRVFLGSFVHSKDLSDSGFEILHDTLLGVGNDGRIVFIEKAEKLEELAKNHAFSPSSVINLKKKYIYILS